MLKAMQTWLSKEYNIPFIGKTSASEILFALLPGIIACLAILYPFYLSSGEFIYLDWNGTAVDLAQYTHFFGIYGQDWLGFRWIPFLLAQLPFVLLFGIASSAIFSKLIFLFVFAIGSLGMYLLLKAYPRPVYLLATALLCLNPFVYERIMMGHFFVVLSLTSLPLALYLAQRFLASPSVSTAWPPALAITLLNVQPHGMAINTFLICFYFLFHALLNRKAIHQLAMPYAQFAVFLLMFNLYWLVPYFLLPAPSIFSTIDLTQREFFQPHVSTNLNTLIKSSGMYGAWREDAMKLAYNYPLLPVSRDVWKAFSVSFVLLLILLSIYVLLQFPRNALFLALAFGWVAGILLATGISHPWTSGIFEWLFASVPLFSGFRDSNKWVETVAIAYAVLAPIGMSLAIGKKNLLPACAIVIIFVLVYNYPVLGLDGQIKPGNYPPEYFALSSLAAARGQTIYLPWMAYNTYNWSMSFGVDGRITAPTKFGMPVITFGASEMDAGGVPPATQAIAACLAAQDTACLASKNITRIINDECFMASQMYGWLGNSTIYKKQGCLVAYEVN